MAHSEDAEMGSGDEKMDVEDEDEDNEEGPDVPDDDEDERIYSLEVLKVVKEAQQLRGLRHGDYARYRQYCAKKLHRLRKALRFPQGTRTKYQGRPLRPDMVTNAKFLEIHLFVAERNWSYGMQLKQEMGPDHPRKKFHMLRKFNRAALWASQLVKVCDKIKCDARTRLEVEAYFDWMQGVWFFHKEEWKQALEAFSHSKTIYETIESTVDEETRLLYKQRVDETTPQIRFCAYNIGDKSAVEDLIKMRLQPGSAMGQDVLSKLDDLIAQNRGKQSGASEVNWLGKTIPIKNAKVRVLLISSQELVNEELKAANVKDAPSAGSVSSIQLLHSYITCLKNQRSNDRSLLTIQIMTGHAKLSPEKDAEEKKKKHKPQDFIRLYDTVVENNTEIVALPGAAGTSLVETLNTQSLLYKAHRALHIGSAFVAAKKYAEGLAFFGRVGEYAEQAKKSLPKFDNPKEVQKELDDLTSAVKAQQESAVVYSVLAGDEFADVEGEILARLRKPETGAVDLPVAKPFTFDLVLDSIKLPSLEDRLPVKKTPLAKAAKSSAAAAANPAEAAGLGSVVKGWLGFGGKKK
ncbi:Signal recognition particle subunit SRP68 [Hypsibius exemplaris]|uniref:Signal recognition particle subunit SRP68 n=1 Tax=Hypsibius exemplaris TaxID=2072580 RepID=A0A1W0WKE0_HYPEX|nr:Signal recognition particle subunit SRP68 [Hypsibius exemplaris]